MSIPLNDGDLLEGDATTAAKVTYVIGGLDGDSPKRLASGQLPNAKGTLYTAAGVDTITSITLVNTNTSAEAVNLYVQDGTASRQILKIVALGAGYHALFDGNKLSIYDENGSLQIETTVLAHAASHQNAGSDEISVTGLSGLLADDQHVLDAEVTAVAIAKATMDADTVLTATTDDTPVATTLAEQTVLGRLTGGHPDDVVIGISNDNILQVDDASAADNEYARFTAAGLEGRTSAEVITDLLSTTLPENTSIDLEDVLTADGKYTGITMVGVAGTTLAFGDLVYLQTADHRWELASADNAAAGHNLRLGICVLAAANDASATKVLLYGTVRADTAFPDLTLGAPVYMSTTAGDVQVAAPSGTTDIIRIVGHGGYTKEELIFAPSPDFLELV